MPNHSHHMQFAIRQEVLTHLIHNEATLEGLATALDQTDTRVQWHLQQLLGDGLVEATDDGLHWHCTEEGRTILAASRPGSRERAFPGRIVTDFEDALLELGDGLYDEDAVQASGEHRSRLSTDQATEFQDRLLDLIAEYFAPGRGDRNGVKYGFHWILSPIDLHPLKDISEREAARALIAMGGTQPDLEVPPRRRPGDITD